MLETVGTCLIDFNFYFALIVEVSSWICSPLEQFEGFGKIFSVFYSEGGINIGRIPSCPGGNGLTREFSCIVQHGWEAYREISRLKSTSFSDKTFIDLKTSTPTEPVPILNTNHYFFFCFVIINFLFFIYYFLLIRRIEYLWEIGLSFLIGKQLILQMFIKTTHWTIRSFTKLPFLLKGELSKPRIMVDDAASVLYGYDFTCYLMRIPYYWIFNKENGIFRFTLKNWLELPDAIIWHPFVRYSIDYTIILTFPFICLCSIIIFILLYFCAYKILSNTLNTLLFSNSFILIIHLFFLWALTIYTTYFTNIKAQKGKFLLIFSIFAFLLLCNIQGFISFMFILTSSLIGNFSIAISLFIMILGLIFVIHSFKLFFNLFHFSGVSLWISMMIGPLEIASFTFRVISLPVRLFANIMAGHTLFKIIMIFAHKVILLEWGFFFNLIFSLLLYCIAWLEAGVAILQAYIFATLTAIYLQDIGLTH